MGLVVDKFISIALCSKIKQKREKGETKTEKLQIPGITVCYICSHPAELWYMYTIRQGHKAEWNNGVQAAVIVIEDSIKTE